MWILSIACGLGVLTTCAGIALVSRPAAVIVLGLALVALSALGAYAMGSGE